MTALATPPAEAFAPHDGARYVAISASLMPDEVLLGRRLRELKRRLLIGIAGLLAVLLLAFAASWLQTESSHSDLSSEQHRATVETKTLQNYQPLVNAQNESSGIVSTLSTLMTGDLQWPALMAHLRSVAPGGTTLSSISGSITTGTSADSAASGAADSLDILNQTGQQAVGTLTISGTARDKNAVAAFADKLITIPGIAAPLVSSVTGASGTITFSINTLITSAALGGRFAPTSTPSPTGGN
jgi:Tfp pilus assembly protein PilN